jgi:hypothetical protein
MRRTLPDQNLARLQALWAALHAWVFGRIGRSKVGLIESVQIKVHLQNALPEQ